MSFIVTIEMAEKGWTNELIDLLEDQRVKEIIIQKKTPLLHIACQNGNLELTKALLNKGFSVLMKDKVNERSELNLYFYLHNKKERKYMRTNC